MEILIWNYSMTSWIKTGMPAKPVGKTSLLFETTDAGFCSQFNNYYYSVIYAKSEKMPLYVNDSLNAVSIRYPLIQNTFMNTGARFTDGQVAEAISLKKRAPQLRTFLNGVKNFDDAKDILAWNPGMLNQIDTVLSRVKVPEIDVGVHIRAGDKAVESKPVPVDTYIQSVKAFQKRTKKDELTVFVMTDSANSLEEFKRKKDPSWTIFTVRSPTDVNGHVQRDFNAATRTFRMNAYLEFVAELYLMQQVPYVVCTFSSNVGRFLFLTANEVVVSVDEPKFIAM